MLKSGTFPTQVFVVGRESEQNCGVTNFILIFVFPFAFHTAGVYSQAEIRMCSLTPKSFQLYSKRG
jgi:hypothetical protein